MHEAVMSENVFTAQQPPGSARKQQQRAENVQALAVRAVQVIIAVGFFALWEWGTRTGAT